jgi:hypothetical protein
VPVVLVGTETVTELPEEVVTVWLVPPLILYVKVYGTVPFAPVNVITGEAEFLQADVVPLTVAVGKGLTTTVALPVCV